MDILRRRHTGFCCSCCCGPRRSSRSWSFLPKPVALLTSGSAAPLLRRSVFPSTFLFHRLVALRDFGGTRGLFFSYVLTKTPAMVIQEDQKTRSSVSQYPGNESERKENDLQSNTRRERERVDGSIPPWGESKQASTHLRLPRH